LYLYQAGMSEAMQALVIPKVHWHRVVFERGRWAHLFEKDAPHLRVVVVLRMERDQVRYPEVQNPHMPLMLNKLPYSVPTIWDDVIAE
jgi:hypothetical protein